MNILHLVLFSNSSYYYSMYYAIRKYYKKFNNINTYFYTYTNDIDEDYIIIDDMLYIKGSETIIPGILDKTLKAFEIFQKNNFDYVVRSNISSIIDLNLLIKELTINPIHYGGANLLTLNLIEESNGIYDNTWLGTKFIQGTCIIFSKQMLNEILNRKYLIRRNIIDDIAFGILLREHFPKIIIKTFIGKFVIIPDFDLNYGYSINDKNIKYSLIKNYINTNNIICYRNKNTIKSNNLLQIEYLVDILINKLK